MSDTAELWMLSAVAGVCVNVTDPAESSGNVFYIKQLVLVEKLAHGS